MAIHHIICQKCQTDNINTDYCTNCGSIINIVLKRKLEEEDYKKKVALAKKEKSLSKMELIINRLKDHPNILIRSVFKVFYSIGLLIYLIASAIAFIIASLAG